MAPASNLHATCPAAGLKHSMPSREARPSDTSSLAVKVNIDNKSINRVATPSIQINSPHALEQCTTCTNLAACFRAVHHVHSPHSMPWSASPHVLQHLTHALEQYITCAHLTSCFGAVHHVHSPQTMLCSTSRHALEHLTTCSKPKKLHRLLSFVIFFTCQDIAMPKWASAKKGSKQKIKTKQGGKEHIG
eukprot:1146041-Pelagomonas_calceolata.AAC.4